jgi:hypothetical protein
VAASALASGVAGAAASVLLGVLLAPLTLAVPYVAPREPALDAWKPRARRAWPLICAANALLSMGVATGLAAPPIPWLVDARRRLSRSYLDEHFYGWSALFMLGEKSGTVVNEYLVGGSAGIYLGLLLCAAAWGQGLRVGARVRGVAVLGATTGAGGCCAPSIPGILGCLWAGFLFVLAGGGVNWVVNGFMTLYKRGAFNPAAAVSTSPGAALLALSVACLFLSAVLYSVAGCCALGPLPGVGIAAHPHCCCVERNRSRRPPDTGCCCLPEVAGPQQPVLQPAAPDSDDDDADRPSPRPPPRAAAQRPKRLQLRAAAAPASEELWRKGADADPAPPTAPVPPTPRAPTAPVPPMYGDV